MSEQTDFLILRQVKDQVLSEEEFSKLIKDKHLDYDEFFKKEIPFENLPQFIHMGHLKWVDKDTKEVYDELMDTFFNSMFTSLKNEFGLSAYGNRTQMVIAPNSAEYMLEAINYILSEKYDRILETDVYMNNQYIPIFGECYTPYFLFKNPDFCEINHEEVKGERGMLNRIKTVLSAFLLMIDDADWRELSYKLVYYCC